MDTTIISDGSTSTDDAAITEVAVAAEAAGQSSANAALAQESANVAETSATVATSAASTVIDSTERSESAANAATTAATVAESSLSEAEQIRDEIRTTLTSFASEVRNAFRQPDSDETATVPASPRPRVPVSGPENDTAPGKPHWYYRKWGRSE